MSKEVLKTLLRLCGTAASAAAVSYCGKLMLLPGS
jgi:hypothetical protein